MTDSNIFWVNYLFNSSLGSGPNPDIKDRTLLHFPWVHPPQTTGVIMLNGHPICWLVFLLSLTSSLNREDKQRGLKDWAKGHDIMQKWTQKTKILPLSDLLFLFHFYSLASFHSPFPIMLHLSSIVLLLTILKYFKDPPTGHWCSFQGKLAGFSCYKAELCQISSSLRRLTLFPKNSWRKTTHTKSADLCWPL